MLSAGFGGKEGIESNYARNFGQRLIKGFCYKLLQFQRQITINLLCKVNDLNQASVLVFVKVNYACDFVILLFVALLTAGAFDWFADHSLRPPYLIFEYL
jgi:hypothetical protein